MAPKPLLMSKNHPIGSNALLSGRAIMNPKPASSNKLAMPLRNQLQVESNSQPKSSVQSRASFFPRSDMLKMLLLPTLMFAMPPPANGAIGQAPYPFTKNSPIKKGNEKKHTPF